MIEKDGYLNIPREHGYVMVVMKLKTKSNVPDECVKYNQIRWQLLSSSKISATSCNKLYSITNNLLAKTKLTPLPTVFPLPYLPELFFAFFFSFFSW